MTWEQKFAALKALTMSAHLTTNVDGKWVCSVRGLEETSDNSCVLVGVTGWGETPEAAVENFWLRVDQQPADYYFVLDAMSDNKRRHMKWNGFMWTDVPVRSKVSA